MNVCVCVCTCVCMSMCTFVRMCICVFMCMVVCGYMYIGWCVCKCARGHSDSTPGTNVGDDGAPPCAGCCVGPGGAEIRGS